MRSSLTAAMIEAMAAQSTGETFVHLLTINHEDLASPDAPLRFASDGPILHSTDPYVRKTVSNGEDYYYVPMQVSLPTDKAGTPPQGQISVSNVSREAVALSRAVTTPAQATIQLCLASDPDSVVTLPTFDIVTRKIDAPLIVFSLTITALTLEQYPGGCFTPSSFPALGGF